MADISGMDILRIHPTNDVAKECFNELIAQKIYGTLNSHHGQYVVHSGTGVLDKDYQPSDSAVHGSENGETRRMNLGYFRIGLDTPSFQGGHTSSDPRSSQGSFLKQAHLFLQIHLQSGAWMLRASGPAELDDEPMPTISSWCLHKPRTDLKVCGLRFRIEFAIKNAEDEKIYISDRNKWMTDYGIPLPISKSSGIPFKSDMRLESAIFRTGLGTGSYGTVFDGFSPITGLERFKGTTGIIKVHEVANSLGRTNPLSGDFPYDVYIVQDLGKDLRQYERDRENRESPDYGLHIGVLRQLLEGVYAIHKEGWMHRDITRQNIVYFPGIDAAPPREGFKQAIMYDQKVDIWMLALSLAHCWFPEQMSRHYLTIHDQIETTNMLNDLASRKTIPLVAILMRMLLPDPHSRPGAAELLRNRIFGTKARN